MDACSVCGRREPVILRSHSGERLCRLCAWKSFRRGVARSLGRPGLLRSGENVLLAIPSWRPGQGLLCAGILPQIERRHNGRVSLLAPESLAPHVRGIQGIESVHTYTPVPRARPSELLAGLIAASLDTARKYGYTSIVLATLAVDHVKAGLDAILSGKGDLLARLLPWTREPMPIVSCLWKLEAEFVFQMTYLAGLHELEAGTAMEETPASILLAEVLPGSPELQFSALESLRRIAYIPQDDHLGST